MEVDAEAVAAVAAVAAAVVSSGCGGMDELNDFSELNAFSDVPLAWTEASEENIGR